MNERNHVAWLIRSSLKTSLQISVNKINFYIDNITNKYTSINHYLYLENTILKIFKIS